MTGELKYSWAGPDDLAEVQAFTAEAFGPDSFQASAARVQWLYFANPLGIHVALCRHQGEVIAFCPHVPQMVIINGLEVRAAFGIDFFVTPQWRRHGIGRKFLDMRLERFDLSLSTGQSAAMSALYQRLGAKDLGAFQIGYYRQRPPAWDQPKRLLRGWAAWLRSTSAPSASQPLSLQTNKVTAATPESDSWLHWRFAGNTPYGDHSVMHDGNSSQAPLAYCRTDMGVENIIGMSSQISARADLLHEVARSRPTAEVQIQFCGSALTADCQKAGFLIRPRANRLIAMTKNPELSDQLTPGCIDLTAAAADADLLRFPTDG